MRSLAEVVHALDVGESLPAGERLLAKQLADMIAPRSPQAVREIRDNAIRTFHQRFVRAASISAAANEIEQALKRFEASEWPRSRDEAVCPYPRGARQLLWTILAAAGATPCNSAIRRIIS